MHTFLRTLSLALLGSLSLACGASKGAPPQGGTDPIDPPAASQDQAPPPIEMETSMGHLRIAPIWHATLSFEINNLTLVVDPWTKAPAARLPKADLILITDMHQDHFDPEAIALVRKPESILIAPKVVADKLPGATVMHNGEERSELGIGITAIPMYNEKRGPEEGKVFHDKGRGNGYVLRFGETRIYLSGDTECTAEMRALTDIDLAFVCMNLPYTMPPIEAAECIKAFRPKVIVPYHYRGSDLGVLETALAGEDGIELLQRDFYVP